MSDFLANGYRSATLPGWEDRSTISLVGPVSEDGFASNLVVTRQLLPANTSATEFGRSQTAGLPDELDDVEFEDQRSTHLNNRELFQSMHRFRVGEQVVKQVQTYMVVEIDQQTIGLVITGTASPQAFDDAMPGFRLFVESFELLDSTAQSPAHTASPSAT